MPNQLSQRGFKLQKAWEEQLLNQKASSRVLKAYTVQPFLCTKPICSATKPRGHEEKTDITITIHMRPGFIRRI
ncbi:MAG: hypothetical protein JXA79_01435 [Deltaproteobacteria bacterium]|nr:hypothetical protein [Deltaproteobacteria bacterium]